MTAYSCRKTSSYPWHGVTPCLQRNTSKKKAMNSHAVHKHAFCEKNKQCDIPLRKSYCFMRVKELFYMCAAVALLAGCTNTKTQSVAKEQPGFQYVFRNPRGRACAL